MPFVLFFCLRKAYNSGNMFFFWVSILTSFSTSFHRVDTNFPFLGGSHMKKVKHT